LFADTARGVSAPENKKDKKKRVKRREKGYCNGVDIFPNQGEMWILACQKIESFKYLSVNPDV
jgi:hypothetical protein